MKKIQWILIGLLLLSTFLFSENNQSVNIHNKTSVVQSVSKTLTINDLGNMGEFFSNIIHGAFEPMNYIITIGLSIFGLVIGGLYFYFEKRMDENIREMNSLKKEFKETIKEVQLAKKEEIREEVKQQIVYGLDKALDKAQEHAYLKVEYAVDKLTEEVQRRRFYYQGLIYQINQIKKYEYENVMKEEVDLIEKIERVIQIQAKYNEINNHDISKLFSKNIERDVVPTAKKLSDYKNIKHTIQKFLVKSLENDNLNFVQKTQIKDVLKEKYAWEEEKSAE